MKDPTACPSSSTTTPESDDDDSLLANSEYLTHQELLKRRRHRLRRLSSIYRAHYWSLMENVRRQHRQYLWKFGRDTDENNRGVVSGETSNSNNNHNQHRNRHVNEDNRNQGSNREEGSEGEKLGFKRCGFPECGAKAMAMTRYCLRHILSDSNQVLYTSCQYPHKSGVDPILCGKPILKSIVPSMCPNHVKMTEMLIKRALKKGGVSVAATNKLAPKFHLVLAQYVNLIQDKRRAALSNRVADVEDEDISI